MYVGKGQIFNLMDTNGRRSDVVNAMNIYLKCLEETYEELDSTTWKPFPKSISQFVFYQKAIEASNDVFKKHPAYDQVIDTLESHDAMNNFLACDKPAVDYALGNDRNDFYKNVDVNVQKRGRDYTNNLVKIGFTDENRQITSVGIAALDEIPIKRDDIEQLLPIDDTNLLYLRQLLKLRIFCDDGSGQYCAPIIMAIHLLLKHPRMYREDFANLIQTLSPYKPIDDIDQYIDNYFKNGSIDIDKVIPKAFETSKELDDEVLVNYYKNAKSFESVNVYLEFYHHLYAFVLHKNKRSLDSLLEYWTNRKSVLNKAFGYNRSLFNTKNAGDIENFLRDNDNLPFLQDIDTFNEELYRRFCSSKTYDGCREYFDTTMRLLSVTGVFKFKNGLVELAYPEIFTQLFKYIPINRVVFSHTAPETMASYNTYFTSNTPITKILLIDDKVPSILFTLKETYHVDSASEISDILSSQRQEEFKLFIKTEYPKKRTIELLDLFMDRKNDKKIKEVNPNATVPTIFEYIVGISWYYLSGEDFDLLNSFNLSLDADFRPVSHAGGGDGDIVIDYGKYVVMLEVTLMNAQAQKRGEWEPVLRHTVNKKAVCPDRYALTFFIADELDANTINIWRAVSMVPLTTTDGTDITVDDVRIMPISVNELRDFLEHGIKAEKLISCAKDSYDRLKDGSEPMNSSWREDYLKAVTE